MLSCQLLWSLYLLHTVQYQDDSIHLRILESVPLCYCIWSKKKWTSARCCKGGHILTIQHSIAHRKITASHRLAGTYNIILIDYTAKVSHSHQPFPKMRLGGRCWVGGITECSWRCREVTMATLPHPPPKAAVTLIIFGESPQHTYQRGEGRGKHTRTIKPLDPQWSTNNYCKCCTSCYELAQKPLHARDGKCCPLTGFDKRRLL